jgi:hypothetical protein
MEDYAIVSRVCMVVVNIPIAGVDMDFNCAKTMDSVDNDFGV